MMTDGHDTEKMQMVKPQYVIMQQPEEEHSSIDLFHLFSRLYKRRLSIIGITALCTLIAVAFALLSSPVYQVTTHISQPSANQYHILKLNAGIKISGNALFNAFIRRLEQKSNVIAFLHDTAEKNDNLSADAMQKKIATLYNKSKNFQVEIKRHRKEDIKDKFGDGSTEVELIVNSPRLDLDAAESNAYLAYTNQKVIESLIAEQRALTDRSIKELQKSIDHAVSFVTRERKTEITRLLNKQQLALDVLNNEIEGLVQRDNRDRALAIKRYEHALQTARSLGIINYSLSQKTDQRGVVIDVNNHYKEELYMRGTKYLQHELAILKSQQHTEGFEAKLSALQQKIFLIKNDKKILDLINRKDDTPYTKAVTAKMHEIQWLKSLSFDVPGVSSYHIDGVPVIDTHPIKPKKILIVLIGMVLGFMLAIFTAFIQTELAHRRELAP